MNETEVVEVEESLRKVLAEGGFGWLLTQVDEAPGLQAQSKEQKDPLEVERRSPRDRLTMLIDSALFVLRETQNLEDYLGSRSLKDWGAHEIILRDPYLDADRVVTPGVLDTKAKPLMRLLTQLKERAHG